MLSDNDLIPAEQIEARIFWLRDKKVMLDKDLARLYQVKPIALRQQVKRNIDRFPNDFMFQLTEEEAEILVSQNVIPSKKSLGGHLPYAFTEQGVAMLSSVLKSKRAIMVNIQIMRAFAKLREMLISNAELKQKIEAMEAKYDKQFKVVFDTLHQLIVPQVKPRPKIGFKQTGSKVAQKKGI